MRTTLARSDTIALADPDLTDRTANLTRNARVSWDLERLFMGRYNHYPEQKQATSRASHGVAFIAFVHAVAFVYIYVYTSHKARKRGSYVGS